MYEVERSRHRHNPLTLQLTKDRDVSVLTGAPITFQFREIEALLLHPVTPRPELARPVRLLNGGRAGRDDLPS
jgi:hypothetical protein